MLQNSPFSTNTFTISYDLTDRFQKDEYVRTGIKSTGYQSLKIELDTPEKRELELNYKKPFIAFTPRIGTVIIENARLGGLRLGVTPIEFDHLLTEDEAITEMRRMIAEAEALQPQFAAMHEQRKAEQERAAREERERKEQAAEAARVKRQQQIEAARTIKWNPDTGKAIVNLHEAVAAAADAIDCEWVKEVSGINYKKQDGWMYEGEFVNKRKMEISRSEERSVYIVRVNESKRSYSHHVVILEDGVLKEVASTEDTTNWALDLRDTIAGLLPKAPESKPRSVSATDTEWDALKKIAADKGVAVSALLMDLVKTAYPDFPRAGTQWGDASRFGKDGQ